MNQTVDSMELQLRSLYEEREKLTNTIGCNDAEEIIGMVRNLEAQLVDLYQRHGHKLDEDGVDVQGLLRHVEELSGHLDDSYGEKSVVFTYENDRPVLRAVWNQSLSEGI
ncbi:MAG: hypothetical protein AAF297_03520 [Planctomycetota bacterium]